MLFSNTLCPHPLTPCGGNWFLSQVPWHQPDLVAPPMMPTPGLFLSPAGPGLPPLHPTGSTFAGSTADRQREITPQAPPINPSSDFSESWALDLNFCQRVLPPTLQKRQGVLLMGSTLLLSSLECFCISLHLISKSEVSLLLPLRGTQDALLFHPLPAGPRFL